MPFTDTDLKLIIFKCLVIFMILIPLTQVRCDYYTSVAGLEDLLASDMYLLDLYENYMEKVHQTNQEIKQFLKEVERTIDEIEKDPEGYYGNPLNAFKTIKRIVVDWKRMEQIVMVDHAAEEFSRNFTTMASENYANATQEDLGGTSRGLARLQKTYALKSEDIADGILMGNEYDSRLSAHDCFEIGRNLYEAGNYNSSSDWLLQARMLLHAELEEYEEYEENVSADFPYLDDVEILEFLGPSMFKIGNYKMAVILNDELLAQDPENKFGLESKRLFEALVLSERRRIPIPLRYQRDSSHMLEFTELTNRLCRGSIHRNASEERHLRCRYVNNNVPYCLIAPFKMEELNDDPFVAIYHDTIYENEMQRIINASKSEIERSLVGEEEDVKFSEGRISKNAWLYYNNNTFLDPIHKRLGYITGLDMTYAEPLQVVNYGIGGHYGTHFDFSDQPDIDFIGEGERIVTALSYINEVELGGATVFPELQLTVKPRKGSLLVWYNLHSSLEPDYRTLHTGCPVLKGSKWVCNEWFNTIGQELIRPCGLEQDGAISQHLKDDFEDES